MAFIAYKNELRQKSSTGWTQFNKAVDGKGTTYATLGTNAIFTYDFLQETTLNTICFYNHDIYSAGRFVRLYSKSTPGGSVSEITNFYPSEDGTYVRRFAEIQSYGIWLAFFGNPEDVHFTDVFLGKSLELEQGMPKGFIPPDQYDQDVLSAGILGSAPVDGVNIIRKPKRCKIPLKNYTSAWFSDNWADLIAGLKQYPAYFSWDDSEKPMYCWLAKKAPLPVYTANTRQSATLDVEGFV